MPGPAPIAVETGLLKQRAKPLRLALETTNRPQLMRHFRLFGELRCPRKSLGEAMTRSTHLLDIALEPDRLCRSGEIWFPG
jgi:hypothetical protein